MRMIAYVPIDTPTHVHALGGVVVLALSVVMVAVAPTLLRRVAGLRGRWVDGVCGGCGYILRGLPTSICPECGADTRVVGSRRSLGMKSSVAIAACLAWLVVLYFMNDLFEAEVRAYLMRLIWGMEWYSGSSHWGRVETADRVRRIIVLCLAAAGGLGTYWLARRWGVRRASHTPA
jgi:hypothetical protein